MGLKSQGVNGVGAIPEMYTFVLLVLFGDGFANCSAWHAWQAGIALLARFSTP